MSRQEAIAHYLSGRYQSANVAAAAVVAQSKLDLQNALQQSKSSKPSSSQLSVETAQCDYARVVLEHAHILVTTIHVLMKRAVVTKDEQWCQYLHFSQTNVSKSNEPIQLTLVQCFQQLEDYFALISELCHTKNSKPVQTKLEPAQYPFLSEAIPSQLLQIAQYLCLISTISRLYHYIYLTRRLTRLASTLSSPATPSSSSTTAATPTPALFLPPSLLTQDQLSDQSKSNASILEMLLSTSQVNTRILLTKCRIVLEDTKITATGSSMVPIPSPITNPMDPSASSALPWADINDFSAIPSYSQHIHTTIQTLVGNIIRSLTSPIPMISKIICTASLLNMSMEYFIPAQVDPTQANTELGSAKRYVLTHVLQMFAHYNFFSELTTMLLLLFQSQQTTTTTHSTTTVSSDSPAPLPGSALSLTKHTLPPTPDPFNVNHNSLITSQILQTPHGALSLAFIFQPILVVFTQLHHILHTYLPFTAAGVEYNMSLSYVNNIMLSQDLGVVLPYFGLPPSQDKDTASLSARLEHLSFLTPNNSSYAQHINALAQPSTSSSASGSGLVQTKSVEQFVLNTMCLVLKFIGMALGNYQQSNPSKDGSILFDINSTRTQWILSILLNATSWVTVQRVKSTRTYVLSATSAIDPKSIENCETDSLPSLESRSESNMSTISTTSVDTNQSESDTDDSELSTTRERAQSTASTSSSSPSSSSSSSPPPPPASLSVAAKSQTPDRGLAIDLECDYLFHYSLSLTNMTLKSYINAQLTSIDCTNPYINNTLSLLALCTPSSVGALGGKVGENIATAFQPQQMYKYDDKLASQFLSLNYSTSLLLPVTFLQVKKILHAQESSINSPSIGYSTQDEIYNDKYSSILSLLQQSHSTTTKASTANKSISQSHTASISQYILVTDFFFSSLHTALSASISTHNTLVEWYREAIFAPPQTPLFTEFKTIFAPSLYASLLPTQLSLITTSSSHSQQHGAMTTSSLPLTAISSITTPQQSLLLLTFDILLCAYSAGLAHHVYLDQQNILTSVYNIPYLTPAFKNTKYYSNHTDKVLLPSRTIDLMHFFVSYLLSVVIHLTQLTHQQTLVTAAPKQTTPAQTLQTFFVPKYIFTLLNLFAASVSKMLQQYTIANGMLTYFVLNSLNISTLSALSTLTTLNPHFTTLIQLVISSTANKQVHAFDSFHKNKAVDYCVQYQPLTSTSYSLTYTVPENENIPSQLIIPQDNIGKCNAIYTSATQLTNTELITDPESLAPIITTPQWLYTLLQYFHYNIVPADIRLCKETMLDEDGNEILHDDEPVPEPGPQQPQNLPADSPFGQRAPRPAAPQESNQPTSLDMLIKYNVVSPYLDSLYGTLSTQALLGEDSPAEKQYVEHVHLHPRGSAQQQKAKHDAIQSTIQALAFLGYIAQLSPQLALFIIRFCPVPLSAASEKLPSQQKLASTPLTSGVEIEVIDETPGEEGNEEHPEVEEVIPDFVPTYPLLSTLLFFATSLSTEMDSVDIFKLEQEQQKDKFESPENRYKDDAGAATTATSNDSSDQFIPFSSYQLLLTKHLTINIFAQLTQDLAVKTLIAAHGVDLYSLLASPDEYMIQYVDWQKESGIPTATIPRTCLAESATKQMIHTNLLFMTPHLTPVSTYSKYINKNYNNNTDKCTNTRIDIFGHMWQPDDMCLSTTPTTAPIRTTFTSRFALHALYSVGVLVASQTIMVAKADVESLLEHVTQSLAMAWHQFEYLSYFDRELLITTEQWYLRHQRVMMKVYPDFKVSSQSTPALSHVAIKQLKDARFPYTTLGSSVLSLLITSTAEIFRQAVESLMYLCVDIKVKQSGVKHKLFFILHAFCGCISAQNPVPSVAQWAQRQKELEGQQHVLDLRPHHLLVQFKCANPSSIDLFNLIHNPSQDQLSKQELQKHIHLQIDPKDPSNVASTNLVAGDLSEQTIKLINTYLGEHLLRDTSIRLAVLQTLHHFALSKADINRDEEQSQTSEQIAALKAAASRGIKSAASGGRVTGTDPQQKDISELFGTPAEMMPIQLLTAPFIIDCLYQVKAAYQYAFVSGLPADVRSVVDQSLLKSITSSTSTNLTTSAPSGHVSMLSAKYSNNLLLPIPVSVMILQILKTYASLKLPNETMMKRFKGQLIWCYNTPSLILDLHSQSNVLQKEMQRRDQEHSTAGGTNQDIAAAKTIYPQRFYYPRKDHASTTLSDTELSQSATSAAAPMMSTDQVTNTTKMTQLWCALALSRITIHTNPFMLREEHFHRIVPLLFDIILSDETTHELTIYEGLLAVTNLLARREEEEYNYCLENNIVGKIITSILVGDVANTFNLDITTAAVELLCNLCGLGVLEAFLNNLLPSLDVIKQSTSKQDGQTTTTISNNAVLLLRILIQFGTYDEEGEKNLYQRQTDGTIETLVTTTSLLRLKCAALGCIAMLCGASPYLAACVAATTISSQAPVEGKEGETTNNEISAPVALMALYQAPVQSPDHEQGRADQSTGTVLGYKDVRTRCRHALAYIQKVLPMIKPGAELSRESW